MKVPGFSDLTKQAKGLKQHKPYFAFKHRVAIRVSPRNRCAFLTRLCSLLNICLLLFDQWGYSLDLLYGSKNAAFQYDQKFKVSAKAEDGVTYALNVSKKTDKVVSELKAAYDYKAYAIEASVAQTGKVGVKGTISDLFTPGLRVSTSASIPLTAPAKLSIGYTRPHLNLSTSIALAAAPKVDASLTTGHSNITVGVDGSYDKEKGGLDKWAVGTGYTAPDYQVGLILGDKGETLKAALSYKLNSVTSAATEIHKAIRGDGTSLFVAGVSHKYESGAVVKTKLDSNGILSCLWQQDIEKGTNVAFSGEVDVKNLEKTAKVGVSVEMNG
eukprot:g1399.t1